MTLEQRFTRLLELLPAEGTITLTRADLQTLLGPSSEADAPAVSIARSDWLTPKEVAKAIGRSPSRVRDLRGDGHFTNAEWNGKEFVTPPADVEAYLKWRSSAYAPPKRKKPEVENVPSPTPKSGERIPSDAAPASRPATDLSGWKRRKKE